MRSLFVKQLEQMNGALAMIDHKIAVYSEHLAATPVADVDPQAPAPTLAGKGTRAT